VTGRRTDGYHLLDTVVAFADIGDTVTVSAADDLSLQVCGPLAHHAPADGRNLAMRAAVLLREKLGLSLGAAIRLDKVLPAGAGLGGGSSDAGATLLALNELWGLGMTSIQLAELGRPLGADVPMCVHGRMLRALGIGELVEPLPGWPDLPVVLVWPGVPVSTAAVYAHLEDRRNPRLPDPPARATAEDAAAWLSGQRNDLEVPAIAAEPAIRRVLDGLAETPGCLLARMSGSGSGCFGIYGSREQAEAAAADLRHQEPRWWVEACLAR
jgi:4-diphosphocytidyl-2-C-methyl-D-erythritol kinase